MEDLQKEFIPYELALRMKQLGFDEPCLVVYRGGSLYGSGTSVNGYYDDGHWELEKNSNYGGKIHQWVSAPTFSQVFRWFRDKYDLWYCIKKYPTSENPNRCYYELTGNNINADKDESQNSYMSGWFDSYEEAELACLEKLIEIVEEKQK